MSINYLNGMNTSGSALSAYRRWMNTISENLANAQTTRTAEGGPYRRQQVSFEAVQSQAASTRAPATSAARLAPAQTHPEHMAASAAGARSADATQPQVQVTISADNETPFTQIHDPAHPDADAGGWVQYPNVNPVTEMVNLILASRAYEANVAALSTDKRMQEMALSIGKQ
jgi:flagellar basal-body rod protein FlgC